MDWYALSASAQQRGNIPRFNLASLIWSTLYSWPEVASSGQQPESVSLSDGVLEGLGLHAESAPCCRLLPALFLAPPSSHGLREGERGREGKDGGGGVVSSRRVESQRAQTQW